MAPPRTAENPDPQYKAVIKTADIDDAERELRFNRALDILIDEALRQEGQNKRTD